MPVIPALLCGPNSGSVTGMIRGSSGPKGVVIFDQPQPPKSNRGGLRSWAPGLAPAQGASVYGASSPLVLVVE